MSRDPKYCTLFAENQIGRNNRVKTFRTQNKIMDVFVGPHRLHVSREKVFKVPNSMIEIFSNRTLPWVRVANIESRVEIYHL